MKSYKVVELKKLHNQDIIYYTSVIKYRDFTGSSFFVTWIKSSPTSKYIYLSLILCFKTVILRVK